jgi:hypothetical protein
MISRRRYEGRCFSVERNSGMFPKGSMIRNNMMAAE